MKIVFVSLRGSTAKMAELIKQGIQSEGVSASLAHPSDVTYSEVLNQEVIVLGCPACGNETLDPFDMRPLVNALEGNIQGKKVALFGSYGWGGGKFMRDWEETIKSYGGVLIADGLAMVGAPSSSDTSCIELGKLIARNASSTGSVESISNKVESNLSDGINYLQRKERVVSLFSTDVWSGFKSLGVFKKVQESEKVTSFYLKSTDGKSLPKAKPGQNIAIKFKDKGGVESEVRQYTLSMNVNEDFYRISVKSEEHGKVSRAICRDINEGDLIEATAPMGDFLLKAGSEPIVLIAGGIGVTPMLSMAYSLKNDPRKVDFIYSVTDSTHHSFKEEIKAIEEESNNINVTTVYTRPIIGDVGGRDYTFSRRVKIEWMGDNLPRNAQFYLCGPVNFMRFIYKSLLDIGVSEDQINYELFDLTQSL
ncbi:MAG: flavodoxin domain-containing protein [Clostridium sp.]